MRMNWVKRWDAANRRRQYSCGLIAFWIFRLRISALWTCTNWNVKINSGFLLSWPRFNFYLLQWRKGNSTRKATARNAYFLLTKLYTTGISQIWDPLCDRFIVSFLNFCLVKTLFFSPGCSGVLIFGIIIIIIIQLLHNGFKTCRYNISESYITSYLLALKIDKIIHIIS